MLKPDGDENSPVPTIYSTCPPDAAVNIAAQLIEDQLAACVNAIDCHSTYRWDGDVITEDETILLCKTSADRVDELIERIDALHPHEVPCIERFDATETPKPFAEWIEDSVR